MKKELIELYAEILEICGINPKDNQKKSMHEIIMKSLRTFVNGCNQPAIWCFGEHTKVFMADFIYELKKVNYIIDENIVEV